MNAMLAMSDAYLDLAQINSAIDWAQRATKAQPNYPNAHYTLAYAYRQNGESKKAVEEYQQALRLKPNDVEVMKNIAMCYSDQGLKREAVIWYQAYLKANPKAPDFKRTSDLIADLLREIQNQPITEDPQGPDYYLSAMAGESARRWPATSIPIKVYIDPGVNVPSMRDLNLRIIAEAFVEWMVASQGRISFKFLSSPELADITCYWTSNPTEVTSKGTDRQTGSTTTTEGKKDGKWELRKANMKLLTIGKDGKMVDEKSLKCTCLHEVGHALGLGHSPNSHDIMYFQDTPNGANSLTNRDKATLLKFYE
jgi:predicted Zn-dependent protease